MRGRAWDQSESCSLVLFLLLLKLPKEGAGADNPEKKRPSITPYDIIAQCGSRSLCKLSKPFCCATLVGLWIVLVPGRRIPKGFKNE